MIWTWAGTAAAALALLWLVWTVVLCLARSRRLDRLHVRVDAARVGLEAALARRAAVATEIAQVGQATGAEIPGLPALAAAADAAGGGSVRRLPRRSDDESVAARELVENSLGRALARLDRSGLPGPLHERLAEAEQLVILARRVHNDAVRDTLGLRSRRLVRWFHLAGTAPTPGYFEIADPPESSQTGPAVPAQHRTS